MLQFGIPTKFGWRRPAVPQKAIIFSPEPNVWRLWKNGRLLARKFRTRSEAKAWAN